jgi:hypothetical protein
MRSIPAAMVTSFDLAFVECSTPARLADWYDTFTASGRQMSSTEFSFLVDHVSGLRALEKMAQTEMLSSPQRLADVLNARKGSSYPSARQGTSDNQPCSEAPRQAIWMLGSLLWCLRVNQESFVSPTGVAVNLIELAGDLIRRNLTDGSPAQPLINAYAQGVVLGYYQVKRVGVTFESDGTNFWKPCELESIHEIGLEHGRRIREKNDAARARGTTAHLTESRSILSTASKLDAAKVWSYVFSGCAAAGIILFLLFG